MQCVAIVLNMPFDSGSVSYARFRIVGGPDAVDAELLAALAENVARPPSVGARPEMQAGWAGPRHVYDTDFDPASVVFGETLLLGIRIDTNRVPPELRRAYRAMAERSRAAESATGFASRREKREAKDEADEKCREELGSGRHVKSKHVPVLWNVRERIVFAPIFSDAAGANLRDLFAATFDATVEPLSAGALAHELLSARGLARSHEDAKPSTFTPPPPAAHAENGGNGALPSVPWTFAVPEHKDFLGNEFLIWLWAQSEVGSASIETARGSVAIAIDRSLSMDCAWDVTGKQTLNADGPTRLPEAAMALKIGKWPRKAGMIIAAGGVQCELTFQADRFLVTGCKLPKPDEPPVTSRETIEHRMNALEAIDVALVALFDVFLQRRIGTAWQPERQRIRDWILSKAGVRGARTAPAPRPELIGTAVS
jgi:hypothetical protein